MRAIQFAEYGPPDVLQIVEQPVPAPGPGQVLVRVMAAGVNPADVKWRSGALQAWMPLQLPKVPGYDIAGIVEQVGEGVSAFQQGDRVFTMLNNAVMGAYAEYAVAEAEHLALMAGGLDFVEAAALPTSALTGFQVVDEHVEPAADARVLVTGAVGAVGRSALFAAKRRGANVIAAVREHQKAEALALGADEAIALGLEDLSGAPIQHVLDTVGGADVARLCEHLSESGTIHTVATTPIPAEGLKTGPIFLAVHPDRARLEEIGGLVASGALSMPVAYRLPFEDAAKAHALVEAGGAGGRVVIEVVG